MKKIMSFIFIGLIFAFVACKKDNDGNDNSTSFNQSELLDNWGENIILPSYAEYRNRAFDINKLSQALSNSPTPAEITNLKAAYLNVYGAWQGVSVYEFGPAAEIVFRASTNVYPANTDGIETKISNEELTFSAASDLSKMGLPAIDYLLYGPNPLKGALRISYFKAVSQNLFSNADLLLSNWSSSGKNYVSTFKTSTGTDAGSSIGIMINAINEHLERYHREGKIGIPNGERSFSKTALPTHVEATYEGTISKELAIQNLKTIESIYLGRRINGIDGIGLEEYLNKNSLDSQIKAQFKACFDAYSNINIPIKEAVVNDREKMSTVFNELQKLTFLLKADLPSQLGVLIRYQDSDGD